MTTATIPTPAAEPFAAMNREHWLSQAVALIRPVLEERTGEELPEPIAVSCGWPGGGSARTRIGEAWSQKCSANGTHETYISPVLADPVDVLAVLVHECIHHAVGVDAGHKAPFSRCMRPLALAGKPTATVPNEDEDAGPLFADVWGDVLAALGDYPHARVELVERKKQGTRQLLVECPMCGLKCRMTRTWIDQVGPPLCPQCVDDEGAPLQLEEQ